MMYLGIDIGGSGFKYGLGTSTNGLKYFGNTPLRQRNLEGFKAAVLQIVSDVDKRVGLDTIAAIGIGSPGLIDRESGKVVGVNPNLPFWEGEKPETLIPAEYSIPVFSDNDANLMALAEARALHMDNILGITVGSGIGSGIIVGGLIYRGANGFAGELGHCCIAEDGLPCNCGRKGCVEAYASVDGIRRRLGEENPRYRLMDVPQLLSARNSDPIVEDYISMGRDKLCQAIACAVQLLDPQAVVIGGGGMDLGIYHIDKMAKSIKQHLQQVQADKLAVLKARNGNQAGVMGAIILAEQALVRRSEQNLL